jgi:hypothetical protein
MEAEATVRGEPAPKQKAKTSRGKKGKQSKEEPPPLEDQFEILLEGEELPKPEDAVEPPSLVEPGLAGKTVAICGPGVSIKDLFAEAARAGGSHSLANETWCVDSMGEMLNNDRTFHMSPVDKLDDAAARWISSCRTVYSSCTDERFPNVTTYPIERVIKVRNVAYFNSSAAYAIGFAIAEHVARIKVYGLDPPTAKERANVEFLLCKAIHNNIAVEISGSTTLLDNDVSHDKKVYGFCELEDPLVLTMLNGKMLLRRRSEVSVRKQA